MKTLARTKMLLDADSYLDIILVDKGDDDGYVVWYQNMDDQKRSEREYGGCYQGSYFDARTEGHVKNNRLSAYYEYHRRVADMINRSGGNI